MTAAGVSTLNTRNKSLVKKVKILKKASFEDVLEQLSLEFEITDATQLRVGKLS